MLNNAHPTMSIIKYIWLMLTSAKARMLLVLTFLSVSLSASEQHYTKTSQSEYNSKPEPSQVTRMDCATCIIFNNWIFLWAAKRKQSVQIIMSKTIPVYTIYIINHYINLKILKDSLLSLQCCCFIQCTYITHMTFSILLYKITSYNV